MLNLTTLKCWMLIAVLATGLLLSVQPNNKIEPSHSEQETCAEVVKSPTSKPLNQTVPETKELDTPSMVVANGQLAIIIDPTTGHIISIADIRKNPPVTLVDGRFAGNTNISPFAVELYDHGQAGSCTPQFPPQIDFCESEDAPCRTIHWQCDEDIAVQATIVLPPNRAAVQFRASVVTTSNHGVFSLTYPVLGSLNSLSKNPDRDTLAIPYEGGLLIHNPLERVRAEAESPLKILRSMKYPQGHSMMMQMLSYQSEGVGGFLMQTKDPYYTVKKFHLVSLTPTLPNPSVVFSVEHLNWDVDDFDDQSGMSLDYPVELVALDQGTWNEAASIYRDWAEQQHWAAEPIAERSDKDRKLFETAAFSVFGLSAREDQTAWYRAFHDLVSDDLPDARVLFVPAWDFHPNGELEGAPIHGFYQAGWDERYWLPYQGAFVDNYRVIKQNHDDFIYPFIFDVLIHDSFPGWDGWSGPIEPLGDSIHWQDIEVLGPNGLPAGAVEPYPGVEGQAHAMSVTNKTFRDFYRWRHRLLVDTEQEGVHLQMDGLYHDISSTVLGLEHYGFDPNVPYRGAGRHRVTASRTNYLDLIGEESERKTSFGIENCTELFVDQIDFYHLGAQGLGPFRAPMRDSDPDNPIFLGVHDWIMSGDAVEIPLFSFVYHAYGAMRTGGKIQMSEEIGDIFYWITASEYLWGGILELIYYNTWTDLLPDINPEDVSCPGGWPCAFQSGWLSEEGGNRAWHYGDEVRYADPEKIEFLRKAARLRTVTAKDYLTSGRMLTPPKIETAEEQVAYDYNFYSHIRGPEFYHSGEFVADSVLAQTWETWDTGQVAIVLANPTATSRRVKISFDPATYQLGTIHPRLADVASSIQCPLGVCVAGQSCDLTVTLPPREFGMIELN